MIMFTPNFYGYSENEIRQYLMARAIEWNTWPGFLSQPIFPILLIFYKWWLVVLFFILASLCWSLVKYRFVNVRMAEFGIFFAKLKWLSIPACAIHFILAGMYGLTALAVLWPIVAASLGAGGRIGDIQFNFARKLGFIPNETAE
jgi:hypothetical protein